MIFLAESNGGGKADKRRTIEKVQKGRRLILLSGARGMPGSRPRATRGVFGMPAVSADCSDRLGAGKSNDLAAGAVAGVGTSVQTPVRTFRSEALQKPCTQSARQRTVAPRFSPLFRRRKAALSGVSCLCTCDKSVLAPKFILEHDSTRALSCLHLLPSNINVYFWMKVSRKENFSS